MDIHTLFQAALGLVPPWQVVGIEFTKPSDSESRGQLTIRLDFPRGSRFGCPECKAQCAVHDTTEKSWRHLDFFEHVAQLQARVPRTNCAEHGILQVSVPWAREGSGFTLLFEAYVMLMAPEMPMAAIARTVGEHDTRLWRLVMEHVEEARERVDMSEVHELVVDETSRAKRHQYVTLFAEPREEQARVLFVAEGANYRTFHEFVRDLEAHGGKPEAIRDVCMDMSEAFQKGASETIFQAAITFDRFHVMKLVNDAVDQVRRLERKQRPELSRTRYDWLVNPERLSKVQAERIEGLSRLDLKTAKAYQMRLALQDLWSYRSIAWAKKYLKRWCTWVLRASPPKSVFEQDLLEPMRRVAWTLRINQRGILNYFRRRMTSAVLEGINSLVQAARSRARGYRNPLTFKTMIYLIAGRLTFQLPSLTHSK
jgi:transposase